MLVKTLNKVLKYLHVLEFFGFFVQNKHKNRKQNDTEKTSKFKKSFLFYSLKFIT